MPRKAPNLNGGVIEHRITLGDYERKMITKQLAEDDIIKKVQTGAEIGKNLLIGGAVVGVGLLATTAYREAQGLVDTIQDTPAGLWKMTQYKLGLISFEDLVGGVTENAQKRQEEKQKRKNLGILEYGFQSLMTFLLGEDMIWTKATESTSSTDDEQINLSPYQELIQSGYVIDEYDIQKYRDFYFHFTGTYDGFTFEKAYNMFKGFESQMQNREEVILTPAAQAYKG